MSLASDKNKLNVPETIKQSFSSDLRLCYQCGKCSTGCPLATEADMRPQELVKLIQLGDMESVLSSKAIWLCISCRTCGSRCPNEIDLSLTIDKLRAYAYTNNISPALPNIVAFHESFLESVGETGRVSEISMIGRYKLKTREFFKDLILGARLFGKGKIVPWPSFVRGRKEVRKILSRIKTK
jgi:heterodisulfide reductase subunit C